MPEHTVGDEECLDTIAFQYGFFPETIWARGENEELRNRRETGYQLAPGDVMHVPEKRLKDIDCAIDKRHRFRRRGVPAKIRIRLLDVYGDPRKNTPYVLEIEPDIYIESTTDQDGMIVQFIPPDAVSGTLTVEAADDEDEEAGAQGGGDEGAGDEGGEGEDGEEEDSGFEVYELALSQLRPSGLIAGVQQRLYNLGFMEPPLSGEMDDRTADALRLFQNTRKIKETGEIDGPTLDEFEKDFQTK